MTPKFARAFCTDGLHDSGQDARRITVERPGRNGVLRVAVEHPHPLALCCKRARQIRGQRRSPDAAPFRLRIEMIAM
jgi:hypothetical protein